MNIKYFLALWLLILNVSCSDNEDDAYNTFEESQNVLIQALENNLSVKDIKDTSDTYDIVFSDNSVMALPQRQNLSYTTIRNNNWFINGASTGLPVMKNNINYSSELQFIDVDNKGNWSINGKNTSLKAHMPAKAPDVPLVANIVEVPHFVYFYFTDKTILRFVNQKNALFTNHKKQKLTSHPKSLKILCIGNSFTEDATNRLPSFIKAAGLNHICIGHLISGGASLKKYYDNYMNDSTSGIFQVTNDEMKWNTLSDNYSLKQALRYANWDIISFQQLSHEAGRYQTYEPYLSNLIDIAKYECNNSKPIFVWQMSWAYGSGCKEEVFKKYDYNQLEMYKDITDMTKILIKQSDIDIIAPIGTAIQNLRNTSLNVSPLDITRDYRHLDEGIGRYTATCTLFQVLIAPAYDTKLIDIPFIGSYGNTSLSEKNYKICMQAAIDACNTPFAITKSPHPNY